MHLTRYFVPVMAVSTALASLPAAAQTEQQDAALDVPYVPTPTEVVKVMLTMAKVQRNDIVYDLGCGDGRLVVTAAERHGARGLGVDIDPVRVSEARANARKAKVTGKVEFKHADLFDIDLRPASVLMMYLLPEVNLRLRPRILEQLRPGSRVVSHDFDMNDWQPDAQQTIDEHRVFLWIVPARVAGTWSWTVPAASGPRQYVATLDQQFQQVEGYARTFANGTSGSAVDKLPLEKPKLVGDQLSFTITDPGGPDNRPILMQYEGSVSNGSTSGVVTLVEGTSTTQVPWNARQQPRIQVGKDRQKETAAP